MPGPGVNDRTTSVNWASTIALNAARSGADTCVLPSKAVMSHTSSSAGAMFQSPTRAIGARRIVLEPACGGIPQRGKPIQLVGVVRILQGAAVGHVQAPHPHAAAGRAQRAGLGGRGSSSGLLLQVGWPVEADLDVVQADPRRDRHAVPLVEARRGRSRSPAPRTASSGTARRCTWFPASPARRHRRGPASR